MNSMEGSPAKLWPRTFAHGQTLRTALTPDAVIDTHVASLFLRP